MGRRLKLTAEVARLRGYSRREKDREDCARLAQEMRAKLEAEVQAKRGQA